MPSVFPNSLYLGFSAQTKAEVQMAQGAGEGAELPGGSRIQTQPPVLELQGALSSQKDPPMGAFNCQRFCSIHAPHRHVLCLSYFFTYF